MSVGIGAGTSWSAICPLAVTPPPPDASTPMSSMSGSAAGAGAVMVNAQEAVVAPATIGQSWAGSEPAALAKVSWRPSIGPYPPLAVATTVSAAPAPTMSPSAGAVMATAGGVASAPREVKAACRRLSRPDGSATIRSYCPGGDARGNGGAAEGSTLSQLTVVSEKDAGAPAAAAAVSRGGEPADVDACAARAGVEPVRRAESRARDDGGEGNVVVGDPGRDSMTATGVSAPTPHPAAAPSNIAAVADRARGIRGILTSRRFSRRTLPCGSAPCGSRRAR